MPDDISPEIGKARKFLEKAVKEYAPFTHAGLNQLPYIFYDNVAKVMHEYAKTTVDADSEKEDELWDELIEFCTEDDDFYTAEFREKLKRKYLITRKEQQ